VTTGATADAVEEIGQEDEAGDRSVCCQAMWVVSCCAKGQVVLGRFVAKPIFVTGE
jgi:hypothetical protein